MNVNTTDDVSALKKERNTVYDNAARKIGSICTKSKRSRAEELQPTTAGD